MGDLRDALRKAGLIDDKTDRRLKHEQRVERKELGRDGLEEKQRREAADRAARDQQRRGEVTAAQARLDQGRAHDERIRRLSASLSEQAIHASGPRRFHWVDPDGHCPWIAIDDESGKRLEAGELALVRALRGPDVVLVPRALALELHAFSPERILHLAGARG
jgi:uncharacterized protein YaiL (DUF2058 family)